MTPLSAFVATSAPALVVGIAALVWRLRRKPTLDPAPLIAHAIAAQLVYEREHGERQVARMHHVHAKHRPSRHDYDNDQRALAVQQRVVRLYADAGGKPPADLAALVARALDEVTDAGEA